MITTLNNSIANLKTQIYKKKDTYKRLYVDTWMI